MPGYWDKLCGVIRVVDWGSQLAKNTRRWWRPMSRNSSVLLISLFLVSSGCSIAPPTENPIPAISSMSGDSQSKTLIVMLPGRGDRGDAFGTAEFDNIANSQNYDVLAVDAHLGYYIARNLLPRLHADVILPARAQGYQNIWLLGVSMGGFGALLYAQEYPGEIDGVILLAPFLGSRGLIEEIEKGGGLSAWQGDTQGYEPYEIDLWRWLKKATGSVDGTPVVLGFGEADNMAPTYDVLIEALGPSQVYKNDGGHRWTTWQPLWRRIAAALELSLPD